MRALRSFLVAAVVGTVFLIPIEAGANGGAYIEFRGQGRGTHFLPGTSVVGIGSVFIPTKKQDLLERGPFYAFLLPRGTTIREGRPIPDGAIRLGAYSVRRLDANAAGGDFFQLRVAFTVPDLPGAFYTVMTCNDPCTIWGFREPLSGSISVVATTREARLITRQWRLQGQVARLRHQLRKAEKGAEDLSGQLDASLAVRSDLGSEVGRLQDELADARTAARVAEGRPLIGAWPAAGIAASLLVLAAILAIRRRRPAPMVVPDTIAELEREVAEPDRR